MTVDVATGENGVESHASRDAATHLPLPRAAGVRDRDLLFSASLPPFFACPPRVILAPSHPHAPRHSDVSHAAVLRSTQHTLARTRPRSSTRRHAPRSWLRPTLCCLASYHVASRPAAPQPVTCACYRSTGCVCSLCVLPACHARPCCAVSRLWAR